MQVQIDRKSTDDKLNTTDTRCKLCAHMGVCEKLTAVLRLGKTIKTQYVVRFNCSDFLQKETK